MEEVKTIEKAELDETAVQYIVVKIGNEQYCQKPENNEST